MIRPSSLPAIAACACFESDQAVNVGDKTSGTIRHEYFRSSLATILKGYPAKTALSAAGQLEEEDREAVDWATDYIVAHAPDGYTAALEEKLSIVNDDFAAVMAGTPDVVIGPALFDLKWRERNYLEQMAAYALAMFQNNAFPQITAHVLFAERRRAEVIVFTEQSAALTVGKMLVRAEDLNRIPTPCDYCGWCARRATCPALVERVAAVATGRDDWKLPTYHASELKNPDDMGRALTLARQIKDWVEGVEFKAKEAALGGAVPTGFRLQERKGNRIIPSVAEAFAKMNLPQEEFLKACDVSFSGLAEVQAAFSGMKKAAAERAVEEKLGDALTRRKPSLSLVKLKE